MEEPLPKHSYLTTPYYRTYGDGNYDMTETCGQGPISYGKAYNLLCLTSRLRVLTDKYFQIRYLAKDDRMECVVAFVSGNEPLLLNPTTHAFLQSAVDKITSEKANECLLFQPVDQLNIPIWYQSWMIDAVDVPISINAKDYEGAEDLQIEIKVIRREDTITHMGSIWLDLADFPIQLGFNEVYTNFQSNIIVQLEEMYKSGYVKTNPETAELLQLSVYKYLNPEKSIVLASPDWDYLTVLGDSRSPVPLLISLIENNQDLSFLSNYK